MKKRIAKISVKLSLAVLIYAVYDLMYCAYISCSDFEFDWLNIAIPVAIIAVAEFVEDLYHAYVKKHASF